MVKLKVGNNEHEMLKIATLILLTRGEDLTVKAKSDAKFLLISGNQLMKKLLEVGHL